MLRLDFVSPLPPVRSGIADYSVDLLPELANLCDLRLIRLPGQPVAPEIVENWPTAPADELGDGGHRLPLYQMGNNDYHSAVYDLALQHPGVLTLHDLVLHHFLIDRTVKRGDFEPYRRQLARDHGWIGEAAARPLRWPGGSGMAAQFALPVNRTLLKSQIGVLTHSEWAREFLLEEVGHLRIRSIAMGVPLGAAWNQRTGDEFRRRHGLPVGRPLLGSFGFQTPMKRTGMVVSALASPELATAHLVVAGEMAPIVELRAQASRLGVEDRVHFLGFLDFSEFEAAIAAVDLCLNLRYPTAGETSASLLRILALGKPALVSDYAQSADLPDAGLVKIPVGEGEREALIGRLSGLLADPQELERLGAEGRRHIAENHRPAMAAKAIADACEKWHQLAPDEKGSTVSQPRIPAPTSLTWHDMKGELEVQGAESPWPDGSRRRLRVRLVNRSRARWLAGERGDGGVAIEIQMLSEGQNLCEGSDWIGLPVDLDPGESQVLELSLRRPIGAAQLRVIPHVLGYAVLEDLGGPVWEQDL